MDNEFYEHLVISGRDENFQNDLTKASIAGWETVHINSFPVEKPDMLKHGYTIELIYTAVLRRLRSREELRDDNRESETVQRGTVDGTIL